jgi:hypothetical protein
MARKDLTALAALGTLGYMLSKKGDKTDAPAAERRIAADREASAEPQSMENDSGMDPEEAANKRVERTLTNPNAKEFGEAGTSMTVTPSARSTSAAPAKPAVVKPRDTAKTDETSNLLSRYAKPGLRQETMKERAESYNAKRFAQKEADKAAVKDFFGNADKRYLQSKLDRGETLSPLERAQAKRAGMEGFKRGGKVKKMASGGMASSASKRADGIATRGKTKCKMY